MTSEANAVSNGDKIDQVNGTVEKTKKKKLGRKQRLRMKAKELNENGMSVEEARKAVGLSPLWNMNLENHRDNHFNGSRPSPAMLTANIKNARDLQEMFQILRMHGHRMNHIHLSAFWNLLGRMASYNGCKSTTWHDDHAEDLNQLVEYTRKVIVANENNVQQIRGRELANILHGVAKSGVGVSNEELISLLAKSAQHHLAECNGQEVANIAWALSKSRYFDSEAFEDLASIAEKHVKNFNSQEITNLLWAFATAGYSENATLLKALAKAVENQLRSFNTKGLSNTAWAFSKINHIDASLFRTIAQTAQQNIKHFNAHDFSTLCWAFAKAGQYDAELFTTLAKHAGRYLDALNAQGLSNAVWAFAKAGHINSELFSAFGRSIERRLFTNGSEFKAIDVANTAWAFGKACHLDESLFKILARTAEQCLDDFNMQDIVNMTWAFAKLGITNSQFFDVVNNALLRSTLDDLEATNIANLAWNFDKVGKLDDKLAKALAQAAEKRVHDFNAPDLANLAWTFANAKKLDRKLFSALARAVEKIIQEFGEEDLDNLEWAFTKANQIRIVNQLKQYRKTAFTANDLIETNVDVSKCGRIIIAGGGIGGAAIAVALQRKGFNVTVLEADASFDARSQGYGLTIQATDAMQVMGIDVSRDDAPSTSHYTFSSKGQVIGFFGEAFGVKSKDRHEVQNSGRFIHIPRQVFRARFVEAVRPETIRWNSKLQSFKETKNGVLVTLTDGTTLEGALLIGSDGIFSTVRRQLNLSGDRLNYVGLCVVLGIIDERVMPVPLAQRRIFETVDGTTRIYAMPFTTSSTMWQLSFPCSEETARMYTKDAASLKEEITRRCATWHHPIPEMLEKTPLDCMSGYPVYDRELLEPDVLRPLKTHGRRVTLIGDAAHPMTPFKAQGANQAISDAVLFTDTLIEGIRKRGPVEGFDYALPIFEKKMLIRSSRMVVASREKAKEMHSALALQPARRAQREAEFDLPTVIRVLRESNIGALSATDPRGLDAVVAQAAAETMKLSSASTMPTPQGTKIVFGDEDNENTDESERKEKKWKDKKRRAENSEKQEKDGKEKKDEKKKKDKKEKKKRRKIK